MVIKYITSNSDKYTETKNILKGLDLSHLNINIPEILTINPKEVLEFKGRIAFKEHYGRFIMDHSALYFEQYSYKLPGCITDAMIEVVGLEGICNSINTNRNAISTTVLLYCDGKKFKYFESTLNGRISEKPIGENGFGWDKIFIPQGSTKTFAEHIYEEKIAISSRTLVLKKFMDHLDI